MYMCGLTLAVRQREKSSLAYHFPLLRGVPEPFPPRPCESMKIFHSFEKNSLHYGAEINVLSSYCAGQVVQAISECSHPGLLSYL